MEEEWLGWAKRLHAIASTGEHFGESEFDVERYQEVAVIAHAMLARLGEVPVERIQSLFPDYGIGYATPKIDVRGAVFRGDEVLLVREKGDGLWTLPGGFADVGLSAAENVVKEIQEEANIDVTAAKLYAVKHKAKHGYNPDPRDFYKFFFLCETDTIADPRPGPEVSAADYFDLNELPELSEGRCIAADLHQGLMHRNDPGIPTEFD